MGRKSKYKPEYCDKIVKFFDVPHSFKEQATLATGVETYKDKANDLPTIEGFSKTLKISKQTLHNWVHKFPEFEEAYRQARDMQENMWLQNSLKGLYNAYFAIFVGKNLFGWKDKKEHEIDGKLDIELVNYGKDKNSP